MTTETPWFRRPCLKFGGLRLFLRAPPPALLHPPPLFCFPLQPSRGGAAAIAGVERSSALLQRVGSSHFELPPTLSIYVLVLFICYMLYSIDFLHSRFADSGKVRMPLLFHCRRRSALVEAPVSTEVQFSTSIFFFFLLDYASIIVLSLDASLSS